jgi:putative FmdB family regulatory protein
MPIYEYVCQDCGARFDILRSMKESDTPAPCNHCSGGHTTRQLSVFFAKSADRGAITTSSSGCSGCSSCSGGSCGSCHH